MGKDSWLACCIGKYSHVGVILGITLKKFKTFLWGAYYPYLLLNAYVGQEGILTSFEMLGRERHSLNLTSLTTSSFAVLVGLCERLVESPRRLSK